MIEIIKNDWPGILIILLTFLLLFFFWKKNRNTKLTFILGIILLLHHIITIIDIYFFRFSAAEPDPTKFYWMALNWAKSGKWTFAIGAAFFEQLIGLIFRITSTSKFFASELSVLIFLLTCFALIELLYLINDSTFETPVLIIYGLLPSYLIFCSKLLREPYQILFLMLSVYWGLQFNLKSSKTSLLCCLLSAFLMGIFHRALMFYSLILLFSILILFPAIYSFLNTGKYYLSKKQIFYIAIITILILVILQATVNYDIPGSDILKYIFSGRAIEGAVRYRERLLFEIAPLARANYGILLETSSALLFIKSIVLIYSYYLFAPFPWQVSNWLDIYACAEAILRFSLIIFSILLWYREKDAQKRSIWSLLLFIYFSMTFLWSTGTINYGQSIRHHLLSTWIIIIMGIHGFFDFLKRIKYRKYYDKLK